MHSLSLSLSLLPASVAFVCGVNSFSSLNFHPRHDLLASHMALVMNSVQLLLSVLVAMPEPSTNFVLCSGGQLVTAVLCNGASVCSAHSAIGLSLLPYTIENSCLVCSLLPSINCL